MLTARQTYLFEQLGLDPATEKQVRTLHKELVSKYGVDRDFTQYLVKRLHRQWAQERSRNTAPYLGD